MQLLSCFFSGMRCCAHNSSIACAAIDPAEPIMPPGAGQRSTNVPPALVAGEEASEAPPPPTLLLLIPAPLLPITDAAVDRSVIPNAAIASVAAAAVAAAAVPHWGGGKQPRSGNESNTE